MKNFTLDKDTLSKHQATSSDIASSDVASLIPKNNVASLAPKNITLDEAIAEGRVFIFNKSKPKGDILITFVQPSSGKSFIATIPKTWIPIAVSDSVPTSVIHDSIDFRSYIKSKMLALVSKEEAENILNSADAKEELERIYTSKYVDDGKNRKEEDITSEQVKDYIKEENLLVKDILLRSDKPSIILNELRAIEEELEKSDFIYLIKNTEGTVRLWAEKKLGNLEV